jgi:hypothetical protein
MVQALSAQSNPDTHAAIEPRIDCPRDEAQTVPGGFGHRPWTRADLLSSRGRVCLMELDDGPHELAVIAEFTVSN